MEKDVFRFAFIADSHIGMIHDGSESSKERLDRAIAYINENSIDFVVFGGDQINDRNNEDTDFQLDVLEKSLSTLTVPYYGVIGNHDQGDPKQSWKYIERGLPIRFAVSHKSASFVGVNSSWLRRDSGDKYLQEEWEYLESKLSEISTNCKHRFVVMHWPLFINYPLEKDTFWNTRYRHKLIDLFKRYKVSCVLAGHWHQDIDACWHGISLITSVGIANSIQYQEELSFKVVTVFEDGWSVRRVSVENRHEHKKYRHEHENFNN